MLAQAVQEPAAVPMVDAQDEAEALRELFHLVALLSLGLVDSGKLAAHLRQTPGRSPAPSGARWKP